MSDDHPVHLHEQHDRGPPAEDPYSIDRYTFGDSDVAAHRLHLLAAVFEPSSAALLRL
jgi:hypothetical protein